MQQNTTSAPRATVLKLLDIARRHAVSEGALPFALAWLAMAKLIATGRLTGIARTEGLDVRDGLHALANAGVPAELETAIVNAVSAPQISTGLQREAGFIVADMRGDDAGGSLDLVDVAWWAAAHNRGQSGATPAYDPALCDLVVDSLDAATGDFVWVPFDTSGQFVLRLVRKGAHVLRVGPGYSATELTALLLALDDAPDHHSAVTFADTLQDGNRLERRITHCLVAAPMGMRVPRTPEWRKWESNHEQMRQLWVTPDEMDRVDAWCVAAMWPKVAKRGVFLTSPNLLFAQGQEHRLRKSILLDHAGNMVQTVVSLPQSLLSHTMVAPSILVLDSASSRDSVRMVDVGGTSGDDGRTHRFGKDISVSAVLRLMDSGTAVPQLAADVPIAEVEQCDFSLMPARYVRRVADLGAGRRPLGDLLTSTVRSPVPTKDHHSWPVWEVGIPMLDRWRPIESGYERWMTITRKKADEALLCAGDVVLSIKGTVGKVGIIGDVPSNLATAVARRLIADANFSDNGPTTLAAVAAASCVALRVNRERVLPEYLLLYMRSDDFKRQLEALRVGTTIAHITPPVLLSSVLVPVLPLEEQASLCERYCELQSLEEQVDKLQQRMTDIRGQLFSTASEPT